MRYRQPLPPEAERRIIGRSVPMPGNNTFYNPYATAPDPGPGPQEINNPFVQKPAPTPAIQQLITQHLLGGDDGIRDQDGMQLATGPAKQLGPGITATPAVLPPGFQPAREVSRFSMPFPGAQLSNRQKSQLNQAAVAEQMNLQAQLLAGEQRRNPGAFAEAYSGELGGAADRMLPGAAENRITEQTLMEEAAQRKRLEDHAKLPSTTVQGMEDAWRQHHQQYPFSAPGAERPKTRAERMEEIQQREEMEYQTQLKDFSTQLGLPPIPMRRNERGQLEPAVSIDNLIALQGAQQNRAASDRRDLADIKHRAKVNALKAIKPDGSSAEDMAAYQRAIINAHNEYVRDLDGGEAEPEPPASPEQNNRMAVPPAQLETAKQQAQAAGIQTVVSQDDFDALEPGELFIEPADGQTYRQ